LKNLKIPGYRYFLLRILPIQQNDGIVRWVGTFTDIHQQKLANEILEKNVQARTKELLEKNTELETSNHELQQFAWVVSHDLKEPLRKIQTFNDIIKNKYLVGNEEAISYLDRSIKSSARMTTLINDLLDYSRLSVSSLFRPTDLNSLIDELLTDFDELILNIGATIEVSPLPVVEAIPGQLRQVFQNLISNALKFTRPGVAPILKIESELVNTKNINAPPVADGAFCRIVLTDNGIGFNEKFLERIFIIFQRLNNKDSYEGTGIGLAIAKKIIEKHNGIISARSAENQGAQFLIILPRVQQNAQTASQPKSSLFSV
jgi:light-regulated signal transduction histidine kinase (bacteriophytochrome)